MKSMKLSMGRLRGLALAGSLCLIFGSGCATKPTPAAPVSMNTLEEACNSAISDPAARAKVLVLLKELTTLMDDRAEYLKSYNQRMSALLEEYGTTEAELRSVIEDYNEHRIAGQNRVLEITDEVRALVTAEEWKGLEKIRTEEVQALLDGARWL